MVAALPRSFDATTLAELTGRVPAEAEFREAFSRLVAYPFVYERSDGQLSLHDSIRQALLERWQGQVLSGGDRDEHLRRLLSYYTRCYQQARIAAGALARVGPLMRRVNPARYGHAAERTEELLVRPAIEALHVAMMISPDEGRRWLEATFWELEHERRYGLCGLLVSAFAEDADMVSPEARAWHKGWAAYFAARLANARMRWAEADQHLGRVERFEDVDLKLAAWTYIQKARGLRGQCRFADAEAALDRAIAIHDEHHTDDWNAWSPWSAKADVYQQLWEPVREVAARREALERATKAENFRVVVWQLVSLVSALPAIGDLDGAARYLLDAVPAHGSI